MKDFRESGRQVASACEEDATKPAGELPAGLEFGGLQAPIRLP
ncbi:MAG TPA: hypothetical protein VF092_10475 [Longimicrobium sp.]